MIVRGSRQMMSMPNDSTNDFHCLSCYDRYPSWWQIGNRLSKEVYGALNESLVSNLSDLKKIRYENMRVITALLSNTFILREPPTSRKLFDHIHKITFRYMQFINPVSIKFLTRQERKYSNIAWSIIGNDKI